LPDLAVISRAGMKDARVMDIHVMDIRRIAAGKTDK
jgi:hypothetical protein